MPKSSLNESNSGATSDVASAQKEKLHFLCAHHRDWLYFNSHLAMDYLQQMQLKGEFLAERQCWQEALPQLGCAWETNQILLDIYGPEKLFLVTRLGGLTVQLHNCFERLEQFECAQRVCTDSGSRLLKAAQQLHPETAEYAYILQCVTHLRNPAHFRLYLMKSDPVESQWELH